MYKFITLAVCFFIISAVCNAQSVWELGGEAQHAFGKGANDNMIGGRYEGFSNKSSWGMGLTYNFSSKKSYSQYKGFGFYVGYRRAFNPTENGNFFLGFRAAFTFDNFMGKDKVNGASVMPTFETGYQLLFGSHVFTTPALAYGYSIKLNNQNNSLQEDEGSRFIPGVSLGYRF